jgi:IMP dehydrogenase
MPPLTRRSGSASGRQFLAEAGADAVKVGMGIGSGCTTQEVKATGRGQATALLQIAAARTCLATDSGVYLPLIADGGMGTSAEMVIALALGADALMLGNFLARFTESPGQVIRTAAGASMKEYWMEGSQRARSHRRYAQLRQTFFAEGIVGQVPHLGSIYAKLPALLQVLQAALATAGCRTIDELHTHAVVERQSPLALQDGQIHHMTPLHNGLEH